MKTWWKISAFGLLLLIGACGGGESGGDSTARESGQGSDFTPVIARIGDVEITQGYFDYRYENLSPQDKARYSGENWKNRFLDYLAEETLLYRQAKAEKFQLLQNVERRLDMAERSILVKAYYDKKFREDIEPTEEQIRDYYERNKDSFVKLGMVYGYHIQCADKDKIDRAHAELVKGTRFKDVAVRYSEDEATRSKGGELGWFNPDGYVLGIGYNKLFTDTAFALEPEGFSEPIEIDGKWHIIKIGPKTETEAQPLSDARERIDRNLRPVLAKEAYQEHLKELEVALGVERFGEYQDVEIRTPEQLYQLGAESRNPHAKLYYYKTIFEKFPDHEYADDALFMYGFISSEEFNDVAGAAVAFRRVLRQYAESDFAEQARWMLRNLGGGSPELRGRAAPQSPEEAAERIDQVKG